MKKLFVPAAAALAALLLVTGCEITMGGGSKTERHTATKGQQLLDLKRAKDAGAITDAEFDAQKAKLLEN